MGEAKRRGTYEQRKAATILRVKELNLNGEQIAIMQHTANRAAGGLYCGDSPDMRVLVKAGLMKYAGTKKFVPDPYFRLTSKGRKCLKAVMKKDEK